MLGDVSFAQAFHGPAAAGQKHKEGGKYELI